MCEAMDCSTVLASLSRHINCLSDSNRATRKRALESIRKVLFPADTSLASDVLHDVLVELIKPLLKLVSDPVEKCRELTVGLLRQCLCHVTSPEAFLPYIIPVLEQRLGQQEILEPSEELRLECVEFMDEVIAASGKNITPYLNGIVTVLVRTIPDPYPEVKKLSCRCSSRVAKLVPEHFHMQSESLIKPLLLSISHQHARVRTEVVLCIGAVIQYGNGKSVEDVVSHFAQRLFDHSPLVREAVIQVVGNWLLDLLDRYSFHHRLLPLLLTGLMDEVPEIQAKTEALWHDVGLKYESENEKDLKDKQDFAAADPVHYPAGMERPNLGCRTLVYQNFSRIVSGLIRDLTDWVVETRIKSAQLLYVLMLNEEENITQHLSKILPGLFKACGDDEKVVGEYVVKSAELIGCFVGPDTWCPMVIHAIEAAQSHGSLMVLSGIIRGSPTNKLNPVLTDVTKTLADPKVCQLGDASVQIALVSCVHALISVTEKEHIENHSQEIFTILVTLLALSKTESVSEMAKKLLDDLGASLGLSSSGVLFETHTRATLEHLVADHEQWTRHSSERLIFDRLLMEAGPVTGSVLDLVIPVLQANLHVNKDPEVQMKFFTLLSHLVMKSEQSLGSAEKLHPYIALIVNDMLLPNCVWRAGRTAAAIRTMAVSSLWAVMQGGILNRDNLPGLINGLVKQLQSIMEDDVQMTRLVSCRVLAAILECSGSDLDQDYLHNLYPDLLKRLDDSSNEVRLVMCNVFRAYFSSFREKYEVSLYRAHLEALYRGLLVHMDDPNAEIQKAVLDVLKVAARLSPDMLLKEVDVVRLKHRTTQFCDELQDFVHSLPKPES